MEQKVQLKNGDSITLTLSDRWFESEKDQSERERKFKELAEIAPKHSFSAFTAFISERMK